MSNVFVDKNKIDLLANAISAKSGESLTLTLDEMVEATDSIDTSGITPEGNIDITSAGVTNVTEYATATVPQGEMWVGSSSQYYTENGQRKWRFRGEAAIDYYEGSGAPGFISDGTYEYGSWSTRNAIAKNTTVTPTESSQTIGGANYMMEGAVTVNAISSSYIGSDIPQRNYSDLSVEGTSVIVPRGYYSLTEVKTVPTVNRHSATIGGTGTSSTCYVQYNSIKYYDDEDTFNFAVGETITIVADEIAVDGETVSSSSYNYTLPDSDIYIEMSTGGIAYIEVTELMIPYPTTSLAVVNPSTSTYTVFPADYNADYFYGVTVNAMPTGTAGTPTATKGAVNNHSISVTPSVTNTTGYITGSTKTGTAVTVSASELVSGTLSVTQNGTADVTNYASVDVSVSGGSSVQMDYAESTPSVPTTSISFTGLSGEPTSFAIYAAQELTTGASPFKVACVTFDGTNLFGQIITNTSNAQVTYDNSSFTKSYSNGTLTITSSSSQFQAVEYYLDYSYGGTSACVNTADVQVGSGATSITFTDLEDEPMWWVCNFKSNFSTSSGYQRVVWTAFDFEDQGTIYGMEMDSSAKYSSAHWTSSYSNGSLTITSNGTNQGGYFHQPGYYQLTYVIDASGNYQTKTKTYTPTTSQQTETITADNGYDALKKVDVTVNAMPTMTLPSATSATSSGTSKATITPSSSAQYLNIPTGYNGTAQYYTISASGGGGSATVASTTWTNSSNTATSHQFTSLGGTPKAAFLRCTSSLSRSSSSTNYFIADMVWNGNSCKGNSFRRSNGTYANVTSGYSVTTGTNSITFTSSGTSTTNPGSFYNGTYELVYVY